ncbi:MAG: sodium/proline symporter [Bacteroidales bacterium]
MRTLDVVLLILYAVICVAIGIWSSRRRNSDEYLIAGRHLRIVPFIASVIASYVGGAAIVLYSAYVYQFGISAIAVFVGTAAGFIAFIPYAVKLRRLSAEEKFLTLPDWLYFNFGRRTGMTAAIILGVVYFGMLLNQFIAGSSILSHISGIKYETALMISASVITIYLLLGGFSSVVKTDVFQYLVLFVLFVLLGAILVRGDTAFKGEITDLSRMNPVMTVVFIIFGVLIIFQSAEYWQRVYAAKSLTVVRRGFVWSAILVVITGLVISVVGLSAHLHVPGIEPSSAFAEGLTILVPHNYIGAGLILLFAAIMSSADTIIFVLASSMAKDIVGRVSDKAADDLLVTRYTRLFILLFAVAGFGSAWFFRDLITVIVFITGIGFTVIPVALAAFHFKIRPVAAFASLIAGVIYILLLIIAGKLIPELSIASFAVSLVTLIIFQSVNRKKI